ncbi:MAG: ABC transporter permease, partial [Eubacterium sp.]|nr:ABC transporter permease [Eubacterium sp.]
MNFSILRLTRRSIRSSFGRFLAILLIVTLSVGFFAGLKVTKSAMAETCNDYLTEYNLFDFRLLSTIGFTEEDVKTFQSDSSVSIAEGGKSVDALLQYGEKTAAYKLIAMPSYINIPVLVAGKMPAEKNECIVDARVFGEDCIGKTIELSNENGKEVFDSVETSSYTIVGTASSPLYLGNNRGTANIGSGTLTGFVYIQPANFTSEYFTELYLTLRERASAYSSEYKSIIKNSKEQISETFNTAIENRVYDSLGFSKDDLNSLALLAAMAGEDFDMDQIQEEIEKQFEAPTTYILTREENLGYLSFESDTSIVSGIANILPIFFIIIAMLVCITTMTRMIDEERTQVGVLKAMGYSNGAITGKYLLYSGIATVIGWAIGFFGGTFGIPKIFWFAYSSLYDFAPIKYVFSIKLALGTLAVAIVGILGSSLFSCFRELYSNPAVLIRPLPAASGKRILLEKIKPLWKRLSFLKKVTLRNMFRYKKRLFMMLIGVSCCAGLVLTAFGVRDSMVDIASLQYDNVQTYQMEATFGDEKALNAIASNSDIQDYITCQELRVEISNENDTMRAINYYSFDDTSRLSEFWNFKNGKNIVQFPNADMELKPVIISSGIANKFSVSVGDQILIKNSDNKAIVATISGIFDNYIENIVVAASGSQPSAFAKWEENTALLHTSADSNALAESLMNISGVSAVKQLSETRHSVDIALNSLNYIIWLIVAFAGVLEFVVIFNLTNINIAERRREIATVQVLGFYPKEQNSYVLRENLVLSIISSFIGLPLGILFHTSVMKLITIDRIAFDLSIKPLSFGVALICTILFAMLVNQFMKRRIDRIPMAESLKA